MIVRHQARGISGYVMEREGGLMTMRVEVDLSVYAKGSRARKRIEKIVLEILSQIRETENMKVLGKKHYFTDTHEMYETYLLL